MIAAAVVRVGPTAWRATVYPGDETQIEQRFDTATHAIQWCSTVTAITSWQSRVYGWIGYLQPEPKGKRWTRESVRAAVHQSS